MGKNHGYNFSRINGSQWTRCRTCRLIELTKTDITETHFGTSYSSVVKDKSISYTTGNKTINYTYDADSQLTGASGDGYSASYSYDSRGNITNKTINGVSTAFTYANSGWKDQLVSVNGTELTYDANGNVLTCGNKEYTWNTVFLHHKSDG